MNEIVVFVVLGTSFDVQTNRIFFLNLFPPFVLAFVERFATDPLSVPDTHQYMVQRLVEAIVWNFFLFI